MNLNDIPLAPHAEGYIKVAFENDPLFAEQPRTRNEFLITARHHAAAPGADGSSLAQLAEHPLQQKLATDDQQAGRKVVKEIPVRMFFNSAEKALSISYQAYSAERKVPVCRGNGKDAKRLVVLADQTVSEQTVPCPGPERCQFVQSGQAACSRQVRMAVQIEGQDNPLSVFEVRTSSLNTYKALRSQLRLIERRFNGLRQVPLKLTLWQASNEASGYEPFSLMQLALNADSELDAMKKAKEARQALAEAGINDDVDAVMDADGQDEELGVASLNYHAMSELYEPVAPRSGSPAHRLGAGRAASAAATTASNVISAALAGARARDPHAAETREGQLQDVPQ